MFKRWGGFLVWEAREGLFFNKMKQWNVKISEKVGFVRELFYPDRYLFFC